MYQQLLARVAEIRPATPMVQSIETVFPLRPDSVTASITATLLTISSGDNQYINPPEPSREVGLKTNWLRAEDLYVIADSVNPKTKVVYVKVLVKPLVNLIWVAGIVFVLGSLIALWPDAREQPRLVTRLAPATTA